MDGKRMDGKRRDGKREKKKMTKKKSVSDHSTNVMIKVIESELSDKGPKDPFFSPHRFFLETSSGS